MVNKSLLTGKLILALSIVSKAALSNSLKPELLINFLEISFLCLYPRSF